MRPPCDASTSAESSQARHLRCCSISWNICTHLLAAWSHWFASWPLRYQSLNLLIRLLLAVLFSSWVLGSQPWLFCHCFSGPNPWLFYFLGHLARVSSTTPNDFNANFSFRITTVDSSTNQLSSDVTGFKNTQASRDNRSRQFPRTTGMSTTLPMYKICTMLMTSNVDSSISRELHRS